MSDDVIWLAGDERKILKKRKDLEERPWKFAGGKPGRGKKKYKPAQRNALWWDTVTGNDAMRASLGRFYDYSPWKASDYIWTSAWVMVYNHTESSYEHPFWRIYNDTYEGGVGDGPVYNSGDGKCQLYSYQYSAGVKKGYWDVNPTTIYGDAGDGTGEWDDLTWHHILIIHSWNGSMWIDGKRTWYQANIPPTTTWSVEPGTNNGIRDMYLRLLGGRNATVSKPQTAHAGISNMSFWHGNSMVAGDWDEFEAIDPADLWVDRAAAALMNRPVDQLADKTGLLWGYPLQEGCDDVGPYLKHGVMNVNAEISANNGTYDAPTF